MEIKVGDIGPINKAEIDFGDLTLFVGPQASGKSILLQLVKLLIDKDQIRRTLEQYGYVWGSDLGSVLDRYFGEGMSGILGQDSAINFNGDAFQLSDLLLAPSDTAATENLFYIPAQRVVCLQNGWPRFFNDYEDSVPYVLRHFSETLRQYLESNTSNQRSDAIFPRSNWLRSPLRDSFNDSIFHDGKIVLDRRVKKRFKLNIGDSSIPYMAWSAGQKEFMPLLLSFYWLCPDSSTGGKDSIKYVIIEEPEMGLHPQAIESVILQIIDLLSRGYKIIVSTHSPVFLEFAWAFRYLQKAKAGDHYLSELFNLGQSEAVSELFKNILTEKKINTYYFDRENDKVHVKDISSLDAGSDDLSTADWGGLSSFSSKASDIISRVMAQEV
ncbi:ATP-binding protein [Parapedobacter soli]|uniref:ATP-binding protein n=1 Tax=Parapedobacter soli TaxID=416955 RepID=UPI0021C7A4B7|nr:ATP-binding protein [Parapedobacter soli]